jgi:hypothetical protein
MRVGKDLRPEAEQVLFLCQEATKMKARPIMQQLVQRLVEQHGADLDPVGAFLRYLTLVAIVIRSLFPE